MQEVSERRRETVRATRPDRRRLRRRNGRKHGAGGQKLDCRLFSSQKSLSAHQHFLPVPSGVPCGHAGALLSDRGRLLDASAAPNNASAQPISPRDVSLTLSLPPYLPQIEADG